MIKLSQRNHDKIILNAEILYRIDIKDYSGACEVIRDYLETIAEDAIDNVRTKIDLYSLVGVFGFPFVEVASERLDRNFARNEECINQMSGNLQLLKSIADVKKYSEMEEGK